MSNLLASASTLEALNQSITNFYCGEAKTLEPEKPGVWQVIGSHGLPLLGVRVVKRGKRFRFEMVI